MPAFDPRPLNGWINFPEGVRFQLSRMPYPQFRAAAPALMGADADKDILLYKAWRDVLTEYPSYVAQAIGDCCSWGSGHVVDLTECIEIAIGGEAESYKETCTEALYGAGREIGNMLGNQDGCYGAAMARAVTEIGACPREAVGAYSGQRAKEWGRTGTPAEVKKLMNEHKIGTASMMTTLEELDAGLANGYVGIVCSDVGFSMTRDADGFCNAQGSWNHCMCLIGKRVTGRKGYLVGQSWGGNVPSGPLALDQPNFSFWAEPRVIARMLSQKDSFLFSKFQGYPGRPLPSHWTYDRAA